jgi:hypothetical protein
MSRRGRHGRHGHPAPFRPTGTTSPERAPGVVDARPVHERPVAPSDLASTRPIPAPQDAERHDGDRPDPRLNGNGSHQPSMPPTAVAAEGAQARTATEPMDAGRTTCTTAQLRRFIKSRPWIPMHELRRRFGIWGADDDVTPIRVGDHTLFIGLPEPEGRMIAELLSGGDVGYELSLDPGAPIVVGVYPMRPVPRS